MYYTGKKISQDSLVKMMRFQSQPEFFEDNNENNTQYQNKINYGDFFGDVDNKNNNQDSINEN